MRIRTGYSFRSAVGDLKQVCSRLKEIGSTAGPITDTASTFGFVRWKKLCEENDLKPVFGVELAVTRSINEKKPITDHWTFLAVNSIKPINDLVELATSQFRYQPLLTQEQALAVDGGEVVRIIGHRTQNIDEIEPQNNLFVGLSPSVSKGYFGKAKARGHSFLACSDNRYVNEGDESLYEVICGRNASTQSYPQFILDDEQWGKSLYWCGLSDRSDALANRDFVADFCEATLLPSKLLIPEKLKTLKQMCHEGAKEIGIDLSDETYSLRLERELILIADKDFEDYFYIIADLCQWARKEMIVGPARGSSCGSLVCFLLKITTIDPIEYDLIFERFIDINRDDLPDIDIDFSDQKRHKVLEYMSNKYGHDHVAQLGTVALYKPRSALKESGAAFDVPPWKTAPVIDAIIERSGGDSRALQATEDTLNETEAGKALIRDYPQMVMAAKMEGHPRHASKHAAGVVVTEKPISNYVAMDARTGAIMCDKKDAESLELLKIDALGLTQLSIFEDALDLSGLDMDTLGSIPLNDHAAFQVLNDGHFSGIFQFNGLAIQSIAKQVKISHLEDIISITALGRPGPLHTGGTNRWIQIKKGELQVSYPHPLFEPFLKNTLGVVAYQEQVMEISRKIGGLSWGDVTSLRKAMSKSLGTEFFDQFGKPFKKSAIKKGVPPEVAEKVWDDLCAYGSWAFNRSHAVAYGTVSYQCCWLKAHYPLEYAAACLTHTDSIDTQIKILREMNEENISYVPADKNLSTDKWAVGKIKGEKVLVGPLSSVNGLGPKLQSQIINARQHNEQMPARAEKLLSPPKTKIDSIWPITDRFNELMPDPKELNIFTAPTKLIDCQSDPSGDKVVVIFVRASQIKPYDENDELRSKRRGHKVRGLTAALNLRVDDDTDSALVRVNRLDYPLMGKPIVERGRAGNSLYAIKGRILSGYRMIIATQIKYVGDMKLDDTR